MGFGSGFYKKIIFNKENVVQGITHMFNTEQRFECSDILRKHENQTVSDEILNLFYISYSNLLLNICILLCM